MKIEVSPLQVALYWYIYHC